MSEATTPSATPSPHSRRAGITNGCVSNGKRFCPDALVTRAHLAVFLDRALRLPDGAAAFTDVDQSGPVARSIGRLAAAEVTRGCDAAGQRFCPDEPVSRGETATLLHRAVVAADGRARAAEPAQESEEPEPRHDAPMVAPPTFVVPLASLR